MKKLISVSLIILAVSIILSGALAVFATEDTPSDEQDFFAKEGEYIKYDPFENPKGSWHIMGPRAVKNEGSENPYPIIVDNSTGSADSFYYVAGSNNMRDLFAEPTLIEYLENDFVIEYELKYGLGDTDGHISIALAYNYHRNYHIDAYISNDATGDIAIVTDRGATSVLESDSILDPESPDKLMEAIYGKGKATRFADPIMVSLRVRVNEDKMPAKIYMYVNGCLVAQTNDEFEALVNDITPEYTITEDGEFPAYALGNILAIKSSVGSVGEINRIKAYTVDNENYTPNGFAAKDYAEKYGNASFDPSVYPELEEESTEESTEGTTESDESTSDLSGSEVSSEEGTSEIADTSVDTESSDITEESSEEATTKRNRYEDDEDEYYIDVISTLCLILGVASAAIVVTALVILKLRTRNK